MSSITVINSYEYDAFGNIKKANEAMGNKFKYVGEQHNEETGVIDWRGADLDC